jgi:hypothetical protein
VAGCCECGDEPSGSGATELVSFKHLAQLSRLSLLEGTTRNCQTICAKILRELQAAVYRAQKGQASLLLVFQATDMLQLTQLQLYQDRKNCSCVTLLLNICVPIS